jgi:hypothetical protein
MGNNFTGPQDNTRKYTNEEIKQNIKILFEKNKNNSVESSYTFSTALEPSETANSFADNIDGGAIKFKSSKNRHLRHNIEEYVTQLQNQYGGDLTDSEHVNNNDLAEFNKIKDYLLNDNNDMQEGGHLTSDLSQFSFEGEEGYAPQKSLFEVLIGGKKKTNTSSIKSLSSSNSSSLESSYLSSSNSYGETDESSLSRTSSASVPMDGHFSPTSYSTDSTNDVNTPYVVQSTESSLETSVSVYDKDVASSQSSELNIVPFYSTESSNKHPYVAKRFKR